MPALTRATLVATATFLAVAIMSAEWNQAATEFRQGELVGRVLAAESGTPLEGAQVTVVDGDVELREWTDSEGRYAFRDLKSGLYWVRADRDGRRAAYCGQVGIDGEAKSIRLGSAEPRAACDITLPRLAVIVGRVLFPSGDPVERAQVTALSVDMRSGQTNDIGEFRIPRVPPGRYTVWAMPGLVEFTSRRPGPPFVATFAGGGKDYASAQWLDVVAGEVDVGDIVLATGEVGVLRGAVTGPDGGPAAGVRLTLNIEARGSASETIVERASATSEVDGSFTFPKVVEGAYHLVARRGRELGSGLAMVSGGETTSIAIAMSEARSIQGRLEFDGLAQGECGGHTVVALPQDGVDNLSRLPVFGEAAADGTFGLNDLWGRQKLEVRCSATGGYRNVRVEVDGKVLSSTVLDVTQLRRGARVNVVASPIGNGIRGVVRDSAGNRAGGLVVVASDDAKLWLAPSNRIWTIRPNDGAFEMLGVPPGNYLVFHEPPRRPAEVRSVTYLSGVRGRAQSVAVAAEGITEVDLRCR